MVQRTRRIDAVAKLVIATCVDRGEMRLRGKTYFERNDNLAVDVVTVLDWLRTRLQYELKVNLKTETVSTSFTPLNDADTAVREEEEERNATEIVRSEKDYSTAMSLLCESSRNGYTRVRQSMLEEFKTVTPDALPSYHMLTKNRPKIVPLLLDKEEDIYDINFGIDVNATVQGAQNEESQPRRGTVVPETEEDAAVSEAQRDDNKIEGAKIAGGYREVALLLKKKKEKNETERLTDNNEKCLIIDSFDGAEHKKTDKKKISFISFSSQLTTKLRIESGTQTPGSSLDILTWQQLNASEKHSTVFPAIRQLYKDKHEMRESGEYENWAFEDMHDAKMSYCLTQHSLWNRRGKPYLLCSCARGEGVTQNRDSSFMCKWISHEEQVRLYERSERRWNRKRSDVGESYTSKKHMDWIDENNEGISHFGIHPTYLRRDCIKFDVFHMKCAITRSTISYEPTFILSQTMDFIEQFSVQMQKF